MGIDGPELSEENWQFSQPLNNDLIHKIAYQQANFEVLLENMSQGVGMFDADCRIVFCNRRFFQIFGIASNETEHVKTLKDVLVLRVRTGCYPDVDACSYVQQCINTINAQQSQTHIHSLRNGVIVLEKHIPFEGGGWLSSFEDITEFYQLKREIEHMAFHDQLTGLPNRHGLVQEIENISSTNVNQVTLLYLDLDGFKAVNDRYGHQIGDELLKLVASRLSASTKNSDKILRLGGDEFAIMSKQSLSDAHAEAMARRIILEIEKPFEIGGHSVEISVSIGILTTTERIVDFDSMLRKADTAMYAAKRTGRGQFCIHRD